MSTADELRELAEFLDLIESRNWDAFDAQRPTLLGGHAHNWGSKSAGASRKTYALSQHESAGHHDVVKRSSYLAEKAILHKDKGMATTKVSTAVGHASAANAALREVAHLHAAEVAAHGRVQSPYQKAREAHLANQFERAREAAGAISRHVAALKAAAHHEV